MSSVHYIFSQDHILRSDPLYGFIFDLPGFTFYQLSGLSFASAFAYMAAADILVHTGSSFAATAATAAEDGQLFFYSLPNEALKLNDTAYQHYSLPSAIPVLEDGRISPMHLQHASRLLQGRIEQQCKANSGAVKLFESNQINGKINCLFHNNSMTYDLSTFAGIGGFVVKEKVVGDSIPWSCKFNSRFCPQTLIFLTPHVAQIRHTFVQMVHRLPAVRW